MNFNILFCFGVILFRNKAINNISNNDLDSERKVTLVSATPLKEVRKCVISFKLIGNKCTSFKIQKLQKMESRFLSTSTP